MYWIVNSYVYDDFWMILQGFFEDFLIIIPSVFYQSTLTSHKVKLSEDFWYMLIEIM